MSKTEYPVLGEETSDYEMSPKATSIWVGLKDFSVYIVRTDEGVVVDIFARGCEDDECLASTYAFDQEAKEVIEERNAEDED